MDSAFLRTPCIIVLETKKTHYLNDAQFEFMLHKWSRLVCQTQNLNNFSQKTNCNHFDGQDVTKLNVRKVPEESY
jgi:hypothetical protein